MPNRIIKETIRTSKSIGSMTDFQFRCWTYLITYVDDYGRGSADAEILKGFVFPRLKRLRESDIEKTLAELADLGAIHLYEVDGEPFFCFPNWSDHQRIQTKKSKFPEPPTVDCGISPYSTVSHRESPPESNPNPNPNILCPPEVGQENDPEEDFKKIYAIYPKKIGRAKAYELYRGWIKGRTIGGKKVKLSNKQIYVAVRSYVRMQEENNTELQFYKNFDTLMNKQILDYVEGI